MNVFVYECVNVCVFVRIVGVVKVVKEGYPDHTQFDSKSDYYDPKATQDNPRYADTTNKQTDIEIQIQIQI